jgi:hypothetical protein
LLADRNQEGSAERLGSEGSRLLDELVRLVAMPPSQQLWPASVNEESLADYLKLIASPSMMNWLLRIFSAVSAIQGYRLVQSWPPLENSRTRLPSRAFPLSTPRKIAALALPPPNIGRA